MAGKATKTNLRAVPPDEPPPEPDPPKVQTLLEAIESGVYLDILKAQRRQMVADLKGASGPALAAMHRQIALLSKEIAALEAEAAAAAEEEAGSGEATGESDEAFDSEAL
ncbi:hypothetical protein [Nocardioides sp.]|uniref:hypothetical protein n=1 Tax=Nocardioides sp. TaxID=35761 RepID=UPI0035AE1AD6